MAQLDSIFASYPSQGFQDIWFSGLEPAEVAHLFNFACRTYGQEAPCAVWERPVDGPQACPGDLQLQDIDHEFTPLRAGGEVLDGVIIRIEDDRLVVDFHSGLEYWNARRQAAFVEWLREHHRQVPHARLEWAHEGCRSAPSEPESALLRLAVVGR